MDLACLGNAPATSSSEREVSNASGEKKGIGSFLLLITSEKRVGIMERLGKRKDSGSMVKGTIRKGDQRKKKHKRAELNAACFDRQKGEGQFCAKIGGRRLMLCPQAEKQIHSNRDRSREARTRRKKAEP